MTSSRKSFKGISSSLKSESLPLSIFPWRLIPFGWISFQMASLSVLTGFDSSKSFRNILSKQKTCQTKENLLRHQGL